MNKSLVVILHYNTVGYTDALYEMLKPYERDDYDLTVLDNGSEKGKSSKYTELVSDENTGYGGGLDLGLQYFISETKYDSFTLLNSDLIIHGYNFFKTLRKLLFSISARCSSGTCKLWPPLSSSSLATRFK